jgi:hypothetical protein
VRKILFIIFHIIILLLIFYLIIYSVRTFIIKKNYELVSLSRSVSEYQQIISQTDNINKYANEIDSILASGDFLPGDTEGTIKANLQNIINNQAMLSHVELKSIEILPNLKSMGFELIGAKIVFASNYNNIYLFSRQLESIFPLLRIKQVTIRASTLLTGNEPDTNYDLDVEFHIYSIMPYIEKKKGAFDAEK